MKYVIFLNGVLVGLLAAILALEIIIALQLAGIIPGVH